MRKSILLFALLGCAPEAAAPTPAPSPSASSSDPKPLPGYVAPTVAQHCGPDFEDVAGGRCRPHLVMHTLAAGYNHSCVVAPDRRVQCWGDNSVGQLGDAHLRFSKTAIFVDGLSDVRAVAAGGHHTCALKSDHTVWCWGSAASGDGGRRPPKTPTPRRVNGLTDVVRLEVAPTFACALKASGTVSCWGENWGGVLGDGTTKSSDTPVDVQELSAVIEIAAGEHHVCALERQNMPAAPTRLKCWGYRLWGKLGDREPAMGTFASLPESVITYTSGNYDLVHGRFFAYIGRSNATWQSWGDDGYGERGMMQVSPKQTDVPSEARAAAQAFALSGGANHTCGIFSRGALQCWGLNSSGQLGDGTQANSAKPVHVAGIAGAIALTSGATHSCAMLTNHAVYCWGRDNFTPNGEGTRGTIANARPTAIVGVSTTASSLEREERL